MVSLNQQGGNRAVSVHQKIPYHDASQPPNSKIPKKKNANTKASERSSADLGSERHASNRKTMRNHASNRETTRIGRTICRRRRRAEVEDEKQTSPSSYIVRTVWARVSPRTRWFGLLRPICQFCPSPFGAMAGPILLLFF